MASTRMMEAASSEYRQAIAEGDTEKVQKIEAWLESAALGESDRSCEWHSGFSPAPRNLRRATRRLVAVTAREVAA